MTLQLNAWQGVLDTLEGAMPGGRLTYEERQRVAAGLAKGLGYAEIARGLGRPGSTVSREVTRNGGRRGYRANQAQQATTWRARRRNVQPATAVTGERAPWERREFEARFVEMMTDTGVPSMAARVLVCLFTSETGGFTSPELVTRLQVSPASISKAVTWLELRGLAWRERVGRRQRYLINDNVWFQAWQASLESMSRWAELTAQGAELYGDSSWAGARMHATSRFFQYLGRDMAQAAEHWRQAFATGG